MKKIITTAILTAIITISGLAGLGPEIYWKFTNPGLKIENGILKMVFDVEVSCSEPGTYHEKLHLVIGYNPEMFGYSVGANNSVGFEALDLVHGDIGGTPFYRITDVSDHSPDCFEVSTSATYNFANPLFMNEVPEFPSFGKYAKIEMVVKDQNQAACIYFYETNMNGHQHYISDSHPLPYVYMDADHTNYDIYLNDLLSYKLSEMVCSDAFMAIKID